VREGDAIGRAGVPLPSTSRLDGGREVGITTRSLASRR
jgi:hypothetical protein